MAVSRRRRGGALPRSAKCAVFAVRCSLLLRFTLQSEGNAGVSVKTRCLQEELLAGVCKAAPAGATSAAHLLAQQRSLTQPHASSFSKKTLSSQPRTPTQHTRRPMRGRAPHYTRWSGVGALLPLLVHTPSSAERHAGTRTSRRRQHRETNTHAQLTIQVLVAAPRQQSPHDTSAGLSCRHELTCCCCRPPAAGWAR